MWPDWDVAENLGGGSFGQVYEIHRDIFGQIDKAALKVLSIPKNKSDIQELRYNGYDDASITAHFKNHLADIVKEYNLMAQLKGCQNVVYCEDVRYIQDESGIGWDIYIKMELLKPLAATLAMPVDEKQVIKIGMDICNALILCKEKGIIHRDIKPQNLFVSDDGTYKLGDFGIAKSIERTMGGTRTGTYNYMAPEVYNNQPQGTALDQYSLGMVLYWILNNRRVPFMPAPPAIPTASQEEEARAKRMSGSEPIPMPANGSEGLKAIVLKAIAHDSKDRYESPAAMRDALAALLQFGGQDPVSVEDKEAEIIEDVSVEFAGFDGTVGSGFDQPVELITPVEGTIGNAWTFDEGSVGSEFNNMFNEFKTEGTVGVDNGPKVAPKVEVTPVQPVAPKVEPKVEHAPVEAAKPVQFKPSVASAKIVEKFDRSGLATFFEVPTDMTWIWHEFVHTLKKCYVDQSNVDKAIDWCNKMRTAGSTFDANKYQPGYEEVKKGLREYYCPAIEDGIASAQREINAGERSLYVFNSEIKGILEIDPYHEVANEMLDFLHKNDVKHELDDNREFQLRMALKRDFLSSKGYIDLGMFYEDNNVERAKWYYERALSLFNIYKPGEDYSAYYRAVIRYTCILAEQGDLDGAKKVLGEQKDLGPKDKEFIQKEFMHASRKKKRIVRRIF